MELKERIEAFFSKENNNKKIHYQDIDGGISSYGIERIINLLSNHISRTFKVVDNIEWTWKTSRGTLPKRIASYVKKEFGIKLSTEVITKIGNYAADNTNKGKSYIFEVDNLKSGFWDAGDFGDDGSCFWGGRSMVKELLQDYDFYAIKFYETAENQCCGIGRCWAKPIKNGFVIFNTYGPYSQLEVARMLANYLGTLYKKIYLYNDNNSGDLLYINNASGLYIGKDTDIERYDFKIDENEYENHCCECGDTEDLEAINGELYCQDCRDSLFRWSHCEDTWLDVEDAVYLEYARDYAHMENCTYIEIVDRWYLTSDVDDYFTTCPHCGEYIEL